MQPEMISLECGATYRIFQPFEDYRQFCPYILVISRGSHPHPIPLPQKTPPAIKDVVYKLLVSTGEDLADLTPRRFLRHPVVKAYLRDHLTNIQLPALSDLHVSLANRSHLRSYIERAKAEHFPQGTGWPGTSI